MKRKLEIVVISDTHLGTRGCHAQELLNYLKSIRPTTLILNGDIVDMWQFRKTYFPKEHIKVINRILKMSLNGTKVYYITGNHDDMLRKFSDLTMGDFHLRDSLSLQVGGKKCWFFHGDVFDNAVIRFRWLAKIGGASYDWLVWLNKKVNFCLQVLGYDKIAFSKVVKMRVKEAVKFIHDFEQQAIEAGRAKAYDVVVCGHVHTPQYRQDGSVLYLNSGDWVENLSALEYENGDWRLYRYDEKEFEQIVISPESLLLEKEEEQKITIEPAFAFAQKILNH
jgi:UDP-2,3-diacylglucosamine pyrophosphatase LpxH